MIWRLLCAGFAFYIAVAAIPHGQFWAVTIAFLLGIAANTDEQRTHEARNDDWAEIDMELETINKLYLELSQVATAKTARQLELETKCARRGRLLQDIFNDDETRMTGALNRRVSDELAGIRNVLND